ncbi:MAG: alkaline phosphatase family protein, partial [Candidatus Cybelea sp.]
MLRNRKLLIATLALLALAGCRASNGLASSPMLPFTGSQRDSLSVTQLASKGRIKHIVIIIQENRSFNNLFYGYPRAKTVKSGLDSRNHTIVLKPISLKTTWDLQHNGQGFIASCHGTGSIPGTDCRMNGFNKELCKAIVYGTHCPKKHEFLAYAYVPHSETAPYFSMAHQYVLADRMYASDFDVSSFISHQYIIAGVNPDSSVDYPINSGDWGCTGGVTDKIAILGKDRKWPVGLEQPCWNLTTIGDELDAAKPMLHWAFYAVKVGALKPRDACGQRHHLGPDANSSRAPGIWSAYQAIEHICHGPDWDEDVKPFSPPSTFLTDIKSGELRAVTWITPRDKDSDHGGSDSASGPSWVASLVNAIGQSKFWDSSAIFIFWDDPGGWYDPEAPKYLMHSDYDSLGYRIPLLIISPYAKKGYVSHTPYEHGTI